jgi:hypothetical protein
LRRPASGPYSFLLRHPEVLAGVSGIARGRGVVVNHSKEQIEDSFRRPLFPRTGGDFAGILLGQGPRHGHPGIHLTHAEYDRHPLRFGDRGGSRAFHFFLDVDGRDSLSPARNVISCMSESLEELNVPHWLKFSGRSGFHLHIPASAFEETLGANPAEVAPELFLDIKHFLVRRAAEECLSDLSDSIVHPKRFYPTSQGIQRLPFSLHEETGLLAVPLDRRDLRHFDPRSARVNRFRVGDSIQAMSPGKGSLDGLLAGLEEEKTRPLPAYHRR